MAGSWKKLIYSNAQGGTINDDYKKANQVGLTPSDITPIFFQPTAGGPTTPGYNNDGGFDLLSSTVPYVLKLTNASDKKLYDKNGNLVDDSSSESGIADQTLVWGRGTEEHSVMAELTDGTATTLSANVFPIGTASYSIANSEMSYSSDTYYMTGSSGAAGSLTLAETNSSPASFGTLTAKNAIFKENGTGVNAINIGSNNITLDGDGDITSVKDIQGVNLLGTASVKGAAASFGTNYAGTAELTIANSGNLATSGTISTASTTNSTNITSGALTTTGGLGVSLNTYIGGVLNVAGACSLDTGGSGSSFGGALDVVGDFSVATNKFQVASGTGNTSINGTLEVGSDLTVTGNFDHNGTTASIANGAMDITAGAAATGWTTAEALTGADPAGSNIDLNISNGTSSDKVFTAGDAYYLVSDANTTVELEVASTATVTAGTSADITFDIINWTDFGDIDGAGTDDNVASGAILYDEAPSMTIITFNQGVTFDGSTTIVDSTNTALTDGVVLINKDGSSATEFSTNANPALVFGVGGGDEGYVGRLQFNNTEGYFSLGQGIAADPTITTENVSTVATTYHGVKAGFVALVDGASSVTHEGTQQDFISTESDGVNMIACDNAGMPHIWIGAAS